MNKRPIKIAFIDWWSGWNYQKNYFTELLSFQNEVAVVSPEKADTIFYSVFGNDHERYDESRLVHFSGESRSKTKGLCTITCNPTDGKNICLPLWSMFMDWFDLKGYGNPDWLVPLQFLFERHITMANNANDGRIPALIGNLDPTSIRTSVLRLLEKCGVINFNNKISNTYYAKHLFLTNYHFSLAMENTIKPGYLTEKVIQAYAAGTVPITLDLDDIQVPYINSKAVVNIKSKELLGSSDPCKYFNGLVQQLMDVAGYNEPLFVNNRVPDAYTPYSIVKQLLPYLNG